MAGIFGIIGDIGKAQIFEDALHYLDFYRSNSIVVNNHTFLGVTAFDSSKTEIFENDNLAILLTGEYYGEHFNATSSKNKLIELFQQYG
ncbi:MAG: hypothetical protein GF313_01655, partial [Caldithrix sp.]|nr:hypothetical protein [Caldithrix sp.]